MHSDPRTAKRNTFFRQIPALLWLIPTLPPPLLGTHPTWVPNLAADLDFVYLYSVPDDSLFKVNNPLV